MSTTTFSGSLTNFTFVQTPDKNSLSHLCSTVRSPKNLSTSEDFSPLSSTIVIFLENISDVFTSPNSFSINAFKNDFNKLIKK